MAMSKTSVTLDAALLAEAREYGVNISRACGTGLADAVREARWTAWQSENAQAIAEYNAYVDEHGLPLEEYRLF